MEKKAGAGDTLGAMVGLKRAVLGALGMLEKKARAGDILDRAGDKEGLRGVRIPMRCPEK